MKLLMAAGLVLLMAGVAAAELTLHVDEEVYRTQAFGGTVAVDATITVDCSDALLRTQDAGNKISVYLHAVHPEQYSSIYDEVVSMSTTGCQEAPDGQISTAATIDVSPGQEADATQPAMIRVTAALDRAPGDTDLGAAYPEAKDDAKFWVAPYAYVRATAKAMATTISNDNGWATLGFSVENLGNSPVVMDYQVFSGSEEIGRGSFDHPLARNSSVAREVSVQLLGTTQEEKLELALQIYSVLDENVSNDFAINYLATHRAQSLSIECSDATDGAACQGADALAQTGAFLEKNGGFIGFVVLGLAALVAIGTKKYRDSVA